MSTVAYRSPAGRGVRVLGWSAAAASVATVVLGLVVAPPDVVQGQAQRLMYVHVPAALTAYLGFAVTLVSSVAYLIRRELRWDLRARVGAEIGVGMAALTIALGMLWGRPVWGVWWAWDPRMVSTAVLCLVYLGYLGVRGLSEDPLVNARRAAAVGIFGFVNVPIVHFSVLWWRSLHQAPTVLDPTAGDPPIPHLMLAALGTGWLAFTLAFWWVFLRRLHALRAVAAARTPEPTATEVAPIHIVPKEPLR